MTWVLWCVLGGWIATGLVAFGYMLASCEADDPAYFREWYRAHLAGCLVFGLWFGPLALFATWVSNSTKHGWRLW